MAIYKELEPLFIYEDNPRSSQATDDIKRDMEMNAPWIALFCGDAWFLEKWGGYPWAFKQSFANGNTGGCFSADDHI